jgi:hypothetical protein
MQRLRDILQQIVTISGPALEVFVVADRDYHPDPDYLAQRLPKQHLQWHIWERAEIENYLLSLPAIERMLAGPKGTPTLETQQVRAEFQRLIGQSRTQAQYRLAAAFDELRKQRNERWDVARMAQLSNEYLDQNWNAMQLSLADAKDVVLPGLKVWLQEQGWGQFSDKKLAELLDPNDLPREVHELAWRLWDFSGAGESGSRGKRETQR